jgi:ferric-dicitrate binding protein FerR (iron transport regulator)
MIERDEIETELQEYLAALPADRRPARDRAARRQRLLPQLRTHAAGERRRVQRRRALVRAAGLIALGGAAATALWLALPGRMTAVSAPVAAPWVSTAPAVPPAAALTVIDGALWMRGETGAHALRAGESVALADMNAFESTADQPARVRLADIVAMTLAPASRARPMVSADATSSLAIALERGRAHFEVRKLGGARRFHVMTPDADVEVRGTVFDVVLSARADGPTCVSVDEGLVQVAKGLRTRLLARGESWDCDAPAASAATTVRTDHPRSVAHSRAQVPDVAAAAPSDLRAQNQIFQAALSAERAGRAGEAAQLYRRLLARAPDGPLSAQARANLSAVTGARH